jgi:hypothetical protein
VEALGVVVLPRASRLDIHGIDTALRTPPKKGVGNEFGTVVAAGTPRSAKNSESVSITSSLVMPRSPFKARRLRVYASPIESHLNWRPLTVWS